MHRELPPLSASLLLLALAPALAVNASPGPAPPTLERLAPRPAGAPSGSEFAELTATMGGRERQRLAIEQILEGNVPDFVRRLRPVMIEASTPDGAEHRLEVFVTPDYLALGDDEDFLRLPFTWPSVRRIVSRLGVLPPTPRLVDLIYARADHRLEPSPLPPGPTMRSTAYYLRHRRIIEGQRAGLPSEDLLAGHKKDIVLARRLLEKRDRIAIYGWHRRNGEPIQPLSTVHGARYADYSHGLRLVHERARVDGEWRSLFDLLADPELAWLISHEGPIPEARRLLQSDRPGPG